MWNEIRKRFGGLSPEERQAEEAKRARQQQELEQYAEDNVYWLYINAQENYSQLAQNMRTSTHQSADLSDRGREMLARMRSDIMRRTSGFSDQLLDASTSRLFDTAEIPHDKRGEITIRALGRAQDYWQERLSQPNLTPEEMIFGQQKATRIRSKLESLTNPDGDAAQPT